MRPTVEEIRKWIDETLTHVYNIEYFFSELGVGQNDPERPHDLVGPGNKFEIDVITGFALQYREPEVDFEVYVEPALKIHRQQYHHRHWNGQVSGPDEMAVGAVDAICSLLESREYQGGAHNFDEIAGIVESNPEYKREWLRTMLGEMRQIGLPEKPRVPSLIHERILERKSRALAMLRVHGYDV